MLEHPALLLLPWPPASHRQGDRGRTSREPTRDIVDPETGETVGFASWRGARRRAWFCWLARPALDVFAREEDDSPLLCTLYCPWLLARAWEVFDAEEHPVGILRGHLVLDRIGRILATVERDVEASTLRFLTQLGYEPSMLTPAEAGCRITFASDLASDPFAKMMLLAAALALTNAHQAEKR